jgi:MFS family permease
LIRNSKANIVTGSLVAGLGAAYITLLYLFLPAYFKNVVHFMPDSFLLVFTIAIFIGSLVTILFGIMSQKINKFLLIAIFALIGLLTVSFIFKTYLAHQYVHVLIIASCVLIGAIWGAIPALLAELFPTSIRYSGVAVSYNLAFAVFGGLAPVISLLLIKLTDKLYAPAYYLIVLAGLVLLISIWLYIKQLMGISSENRHFNNS